MLLLEGAFFLSDEMDFLLGLFIFCKPSWIQLFVGERIDMSILSLSDDLLFSSRSRYMT